MLPAAAGRHTSLFRGSKPPMAGRASGLRPPQRAVRHCPRVNCLHDPADVEAQVRVLSNDGHGNEARRALEAVSVALSDAGAVDLGRLGLPNSRNHARLAEHPSYGRCVLKLTVVPMGDELAALAAWARAGLAGCAVPTVHAHGTADGWQWTLQEFVDGPVGRTNSPAVPAADAFALAARLHVPADDTTLPGALPFVRARLRRAADTRYAALAGDILEAVTALPAVPGVVVHGDFAAHNVIAADRGACAIDPFGLNGPVEYDAACWIARSESTEPVAARIDRLIPSWANPQVLVVLAAAELLDMACRQLNEDVCGRPSWSVAADAFRLLSAA